MDVSMLLLDNRNHHTERDCRLTLLEAFLLQGPHTNTLTKLASLGAGNAEAQATRAPKGVQAWGGGGEERGTRAGIGQAAMAGQAPRLQISRGKTWGGAVKA